MVRESPGKQVTLKGNLNDESANLNDEVRQCKGPGAGWGWCIGEQVECLCGWRDMSQEVSMGR